MSDARVEQIFQIVEPMTEDAPPHGVVLTAMARLALVQQKSGTDPVQFEAAAPTGDGVKAYILMDDVLADNAAAKSAILEQHTFRNDIRMPKRVGEVCTAIRARRIRVESTTWLGSSITNATPVNTEVTVQVGKFEVKTANDQLAGVIKLVEPVLDSANAATGRFEIELEW